MEKPGRKRIATYDATSLMRVIIAAVDANPYANSQNFRTIAEAVAQGYLRGTGRRLTPSAIAEVIRSITEHAARSSDKMAERWTHWITRVEVQSRESYIRPRSPRRRLPIILRSNIYTISEDADLVTTGINQQVAVIGSRNQFQVFQDPAEARAFGSGLLNALNKLESDLEVVEVEPIPWDYAETATAEFEAGLRWRILSEDNNHDDPPP